MNRVLDFPTSDKSILQFPTNSQILERKSEVGATNKVCFTLREIFDSIPLAQCCGYIAEVIISYKLTEYYAENKIAPIDIYNDHSFAGSLDKSYIGFLKSKNSRLSAEAISELTGSNLKRPDILIDNGVIKIFYEIKPASDSGLRDGKKKLKNIEEYFNKYNLDYKRGNKLKIREFELGKFSVLIDEKIIPIKISFNLESESGLILYKLCIETNWKFIISRKKTDLLVKAIYDYFVDAIQGAKELKEKLTEQIKESPITEISGVGIIFIASILAAIYISAASTALIAAIVISSVSLELFIKKELMIEGSENFNIT